MIEIIAAPRRSEWEDSCIWLERRRPCPDPRPDSVEAGTGRKAIPGVPQMPKTRHLLDLATLLAALAGATATASVWIERFETERATHDAGYRLALEQIRAHRPAAAYGRLARLADAGHAPAAETALLMLRHGKSMFGSEWSATEAQQRRWKAMATSAARAQPEIVDNEAGD